MTSKPAFLTTLPNGVKVSTVYVVDGRVRQYETAIIHNNHVSDPVDVNARKGAAGVAHDAVVAWFLYPSQRDTASVRDEKIARAVREVVALEVV